MHLTTVDRRARIGALDLSARVAVVAASTLPAALASTAPTGLDGPDLVCRMALAAVVTTAGLAAGPVARTVPAVVGAAVSAATGSWTWAAVACLALAASAVAPHRGRWGPVASAAVVG
ncbi:MAG: hypothetical protein ACSLFP_14440, partial [Acidimicrobiales bacterium]